MGVWCSKNRESNYDNEIILRQSLYNLMRLLGPDKLLMLAVDNAEIYQICQNNLQMRQMCIVAAVRRYHTEKLLYETVNNRTADYMRLLDQFVAIQDKYEQKIFEETNC